VKELGEGRRWHCGARKVEGLKRTEGRTNDRAWNAVSGFNAVAIVVNIVDDRYV
jgi:hypothetical protein